MHVRAIGQYCTPAFLADRVGAIASPAAAIVRALATARGADWLPYVPSGSLLAIAVRDAGA